MTKVASFPVSFDILNSWLFHFIVVYTFYMFLSTMMVKYSTNNNNLSHKFTEYPNTVTHVDGNLGPGIDHWDSTTSLTIGSRKKRRRSHQEDNTHSATCDIVFGIPYQNVDFYMENDKTEIWSLLAINFCNLHISLAKHKPIKCDGEKLYLYKISSDRKKIDNN